MKNIGKNSEVLLLQDQKRFLESIINLSPDIIYIYDLHEQKNVYINNGICTVLGYSPAEVQVMGNNVVSILMHPDDFKTYLEVAYPNYFKLKDDEPVLNEFRMKHKNGDWVWLNCSEIIYMRDPESKPLQIFGVAHNITGKKYKEDLLKESSEKWQATFNGINNSIFLLDPDGIILQANKTSESLFGNKENILGRHCHEVVHKMNCHYDNCPFVRMKLSKKRETMLLQFDDKWFDVVVDPIFDENSNLISAVHIITDITNSKLETESLRESEERFRLIFEEGQLGIVLVNGADGKFFMVNNSFCNMLGYTKEEMKSLTFMDVTHPDHRSGDVEMISRLWKGQIPNYQTEKRYLNKDGSIIWGELTASPVFNEKGMPLYLLAIIEDITKRKQAELIIQQQNEQLTELNAEKDKFFSIIAHDLKSPFLGFLGLTKELIRSADNISPQELTQLGHTMFQAADNLFHLLQNLLEWSQIQSSSASAAQKDILFTNMIAENIDMVRSKCEQKGISIINMVTSPIHVYADEKMINSVLLNLLSNAVKFTNRNGTVTISAKEVENNMIEISVKDSGIGMNKNMVERLFKVGEKTGRKGTDGELSTGLGLLLCKEFVEKNGGKIWIESREGVGSNFLFMLTRSQK